MKNRKLWYGEELWQVVEVFQPNSEYKNILVQRMLYDQTYENGDTPVEMLIIDAGNDEYYPDTQRVRNLMTSIRKHKKSIEKLERKLSEIWLMNN